MDKYYKNCKTGEITESHKQAVEWYNEGDVDVEIWRNGKRCLTWNAMGI